MNLNKMSSGEYSSYPAAYDDLDKVVGVISVKSLLGCCLAGKKLNFEDYITPAVFVPENSIALNVLEIFRSTEAKMVLVIDEYGGVQGLLTVRDILQSVIGVFQASDLMQEPHILKRSDGSWLVDGATPVDEFMDSFNLSDMPDYERGHYETMGGFILNQMGKIPMTGESFGWSGLRFEIVDMDGLRVDKILIKPTAKAPGPAKGL
jgi:putative hemolysin